MPDDTLVMGRPPKYPWRKVEIGKTFLLGQGTTRASAWSQCCAAARRTGRRFEVASLRKDGLWVIRRLA